jgi:hypothetical protein
VLGTFDVGVSSTTNENDDSQGDEDSQGSNDGGGKADFSLPPGLNPMDLASISIADSNSVVDLVGSFTNATSIVHEEFDARASVVGGTVALGIQGTGVVSVRINKGRQRGRFLLVAQGAPAREKLTLLVNGVAAGTVRSDKHGKVTIKNLRGVKLTDLKSVVANDAHGNVVFSVSF